MAALTKTANLSRLVLKKPTLLYSAVRNHWNKDFKPSPIPLTEEQRRAAAAKYNLHPSEYQTFKDDGTGYGDYPNLPVVSGEVRDPFYPYDFPEIKRNFNEPLNVNEDMFGEDRYNLNYKPLIPGWLQWVQFIGVMGSLFIIYRLCDNFKFFVGTIPKQYPGQGKPHYTFEPKDS